MMRILPLKWKWRGSSVIARVGSNQFIQGVITSLKLYSRWANKVTEWHSSNRFLGVFKNLLHKESEPRRPESDCILGLLLPNIVRNSTKSMLWCRYLFAGIYIINVITGKYWLNWLGKWVRSLSRNKMPRLLLILNA